MPALTKPRHEAFARALVVGMAKNWSQGQAYVAAGYSAKDAGQRGGSAEVCASRLLNRIKPIAERVAELQAAASKRKKITVEDIVEELEEARSLALTIQQPSAAVAATSTKARVLGLQVDKIQITHKNELGQAQSTSELAAQVILNHAKGKIEHIGQVNEGMRKLCIQAMASYAKALDAIVFQACASQARDVTPQA